MIIILFDVENIFNFNFEELQCKSFIVKYDCFGVTCLKFVVITKYESDCDYYLGNSYNFYKLKRKSAKFCYFFVKELFPSEVSRNMFHNCIFEGRLIVVVTYYRHSSPVSISLVTYYTQPNPPSQDTMMEDHPPPARAPHRTSGIIRKTSTLLILTTQINRKEPINVFF